MWHYFIVARFDLIPLLSQFMKSYIFSLYIKELIERTGIIITKVGWYILSKNTNEYIAKETLTL